MLRGLATYGAVDSDRAGRLDAGSRFCAGSGSDLRHVEDGAVDHAVSFAVLMFVCKTDFRLKLVLTHRAMPFIKIFWRSCKEDWYTRLE